MNRLKVRFEYRNPHVRGLVMRDNAGMNPTHLPLIVFHIKQKMTWIGFKPDGGPDVKYLDYVEMVPWHKGVQHFDT